MIFGNFRIPEPYNEPIHDYTPGSPEQVSLANKYRELAQTEREIPCIIDGKEYKTETIVERRCPHNHGQVLAQCHFPGEKEVSLAIDSALKARKKWANTSFHHRACVFLRVAELISGKYRDLMNASTMLVQSKTCHQAEIDAVCEFVDFLRFNLKFAEQIYTEQPMSAKNTWNWLEYRPLEGFVFAITPFNFTAIAGNLSTAPVIMGNVVVWKPATKSILSSYFLMKIFEEAGLPPGVINMLPGEAEVAQTVMKDPNLAAVHFTGSTHVFRQLWKKVAENIENYSSYPRMVGETGGKDFMFVHESAAIDELVTAMVRGAFEYQGQKCSAASRVYMPDTIWDQVKGKLVEQITTIKVGPVDDFSNFMGAVIDEVSYGKIVKYIEGAKNSDKCEILVGGNYDDSQGYFVHPTVILTTDPHYTTMEEEIFGPVLTIYLYNANEYEKTMELCNQTSPYALTGGIFAQDAYAIEKAYEKLRDAAGNFYINDKVTGAVVGQQPFGGSRGSGTNDKAGSYLNLLRWVAPRSVKHTYCPPTDYRYPFLGESN